MCEQPEDSMLNRMWIPCFYMTIDVFHLVSSHLLSRLLRALLFTISLFDCRVTIPQDLRKRHGRSSQTKLKQMGVSHEYLQMFSFFFDSSLYAKPLKRQGFFQSVILMRRLAGRIRELHSRFCQILYRSLLRKVAAILVPTLARYTYPRIPQFLSHTRIGRRCVSCNISYGHCICIQHGNVSYFYSLAH